MKISMKEQSETMLREVLASLTVIHILYAIAFVTQGRYGLAIYNLVSGVMYFIFERVVSDNNISIMIIAITAEIWIHALLVGFIIGFGLGFEVFMIACIPVYFYLLFSNKVESTITYIITGIDFGLYVLIIIAGMLFSHPMTQSNAYFIGFLRVFNAFVTFATLSVVSYSFVKATKESKEGLEKQNVELSELANVEPLTGLLNRRSIKKLLEEAYKGKQEEGKEFAIAICDIDDFKIFNDTYGHSCGDLVLRNVSDIIKNSVRDTDYVCRWGGEEILILFSNADMSRVEIIARRIHNSISKAVIEYEGQKVSVNVTVGLAYSKDSEDIHDIIMKADMYLYEGKNNGKNCVVAR